MRGLAHPGNKAAGSVVQPPDCNAPKDSSPMLQALTLSTNLTSTEKSRSKPDAGYVSRDGEQSFTSRTMRYIKAAHQLNSSPGPHSARHVGAVQGKTPLTSPSALRGRMREAGSETRKLDVGLRVSAVKVTQRQPMELSQGANGDSPYSSKQADGKGTMKRKGVVKSATFSVGSSETIDTAQHGDDRIGRSSSRGVRPNTAPAASENYHTTSSDSTKQPPKRRQLAEAPEPPFALPSFRPSTCSAVNSPLMRPRHVQRPGTPNPKADAVVASANMAANPTANIIVPTSATTRSQPADASQQDWPLARLVAGKASAAHASHHVRNASAFQRLDMDQQSEETPSSCSSSDSSSIAASYEDVAHKAQAYMGQHTDLGQEVARVPSRAIRRQSSLLHKGSTSVGGTQNIGLGGQGVSSGALSNALKSLGSARQTRDCQDAPLPLCQQHQRAASHINGNTVTSCVSTIHEAAAESIEAGAASDDATAHRLLDPLVGECAEIMHLFGMDDDWFEHQFLPYANRALHTDCILSHD